MKKRVVCIFLTVFFSVCCLFGCGKSDEELVRERIDTFVTAYNDGDFDGVLECFDTKTRKTLEATFNLMGGLIGGLTGFSFDLSDFFTLGIAMMDGDVLAIEVSKVTINGEKAVASAQMGYEDIGKESIEDVYITLVKEQDNWFIQDMQEDAPTVLPDTNENESSSTSNPEEDINVDELLANVDSSFLKEQSPSEGLQYALSEDKTYYILTGLGECEDTHIVLPEYPVEYNPLPLKEIRTSFYNVEYITIPASVTKIQSSGWSYSYSDLIALNYLGNLEQWCTMEYIGHSSNPCADNAVLYINGTPVVKTLKIPETTEHINAYAFYQYSKISKIEIGKNVERIGEKAFYGCENLQSISFGNDKALSIDTQTFGCCKKIKNIDFKNKIQSIGEYSFAHCSSLEEIALGNAIEEIDANAFYNCINLKTITKGNTATNISGNAFTDTEYYNNGSNWESGVLYIGNCLYAIKPDVMNVNIKEGTLTISNDIFQNHKNVTNVVFSDSIESITESMFKNCESLETIILSKSLKLIEDNAFRYCSSLVEIVIPDSVESIGVYAFYNCSALKSVTFGKGIKTIKDSFNYTALETIRYNGTFDQWIQINNDCYTYGAEMCGCLVYSTQTGLPLDTIAYNGHYYRIYSRSDGDWEDAKADCEALGGHLVTITSEDENKAIVSYLRGDLNVSRCYEVYIGLSDADEEGHWKWVTGESVDYVNFDNYNNQPNGFDDENYAMLSKVYPEGYWSDETGKGIDSYWDGFFYICEWDTI